jgi:hypothetical protein
LRLNPPVTRTVTYGDKPWQLSPNLTETSLLVGCKQLQAIEKTIRGYATRNALW